MSEVFELSRRQLLIGSLAATSSGILSSLPDLSILAATGQRERLYVNSNCSFTLSLGDVAEDEMRPWTWRMVFADEYGSGPDCPLCSDGLQYAGLQFGIDVEADDFDERAFQQLLDEEHPDSGTLKLSGQYDEWVFRTGSVARAYDLFDEILGHESNLMVSTGGRSIPIAMEQNDEGKFVWLVDKKDITQLEIALQNRGLPIDVVVV